MPLQTALSLMLREALTGEAIPERAQRASIWSATISRTVGDDFEALAGVARRSELVPVARARHAAPSRTHAPADAPTRAASDGDDEDGENPEDEDGDDEQDEGDAEPQATEMAGEMAEGDGEGEEDESEGRRGNGRRRTGG